VCVFASCWAGYSCLQTVVVISYKVLWWAARRQKAATIQACQGMNDCFDSVLYAVYSLFISAIHCLCTDYAVPGCPSSNSHMSTCIMYLVRMLKQTYHQTFSRLSPIILVFPYWMNLQNLGDNTLNRDLKYWTLDKRNCDF